MNYLEAGALPVIEYEGFTQEENAEIRRQGVLVTQINQLMNWSRSNSLWPLLMGLACCGIEMMSAAAAHNDLDRFGVIFRASPRQADVMIVSGTVTKKFAPILKRLYHQMPGPKWVISMGVCATAGGPYVKSYSVVKGVDQLIPVDVYIPGCPPSPQALIYGINLLQDKIRSGRAF
ncbi:NADH-quinone oxidoreductase subunit B family protein [Alicyclobacillus sp. SO9]|uniref:NuoB/complex I 20 kDa subunit family protein n=1 Tax=Alicyclobacillus sp. SO9 TaxID=2665646 RepID=UPI0018E7BBF6|nr:NADH-quinone oxidoreductase subunit B [Alicyclobacillus sp. SO9]QQE78338.1 NADH-quinone oxidoreductase subunit B [Alicyclobacillus sp. SO9]